MMNEAESVAYLRKTFRIRTKNKDLSLLHSMRAMLQRADDEGRNQIGLIIIGFARLHKLKDRQLLKFFDATMDAVIEEAGLKFLQEHGLYRALVASPRLSPICELFFDGWFAAAYTENPMQCTIRRVGADAFRIVSVLPDGKEVEHPEDVTMEQAAEYTNCPRDDLPAMPILN